LNTVALAWANENFVAGFDTHVSDEVLDPNWPVDREKPPTPGSESGVPHCIDAAGAARREFVANGPIRSRRSP